MNLIDYITKLIMINLAFGMLWKWVVLLPLAVISAVFLVVKEYEHLPNFNTLMIRLTGTYFVVSLTSLLALILLCLYFTIAGTIDQESVLLTSHTLLDD